MFRYERPQRGRLRQFYHIGVEAFGVSDPKIDAEILFMLKTVLERLNLEGLSYELNSIGCERCRPNYKKALIDFLKDRINGFCDDCKRRYEFNPMRILDCKIKECVRLRVGSPKVKDFLCEDCKEHFETLLSLLKFAEFPYSINHDMVRGLDYYTRTTFEVRSKQLGAQNAVAAGGRYDRLVEEFGGPPTPAIGFAIGVERVSELLSSSNKIEIPKPDVFIATIGTSAENESLVIANNLRNKGIWTEIGYSKNSLKSQLRKADRLSAHYVLIIGDDELKTGMLKWKRLSDGSRGEVSISQVLEFFERR
jgi:histidyl-tRNA synthetase